MRIQPADLAFDRDGTPYAPAYGDVYHSRDSGPGQARHVFVQGNALPGAWANKRVFTILETGFGLGLNFFATWSAWRADPARCERLHYVSIEKHPFELAALGSLHRRYPEFAPLAAQLREAWPPLVPGLQRLHFEDERLTLTLAFGDVARLLPRLRLRADAIYLDGFAPRCNPEMWSAQLLRGLARLTRPGASIATYSSAGVVRAGLEAAGFALEQCAGFGHKREMLRGRFAPRWPPRRARADEPAPARRHAIVVGAGVAGAAVCERLARRGWHIDLIDSRALTVDHGPAKYAGVFHPHISRDDCILSRAARNAYCYAVSRWAALERTGPRLSWARCGVLQLALERERDAGMMAAIAAHGYPAGYAQYVGPGTAETLAGCALRSGGWWFADGGWMRPASLIAAQLAAAGAGAAGGSCTAHFGVTVGTITRAGDAWQALTADGRRIAAAPVLVLANASDAARLAPIAQALARIRGQLSYLPAACLRAPKVVLTGAGYLLPAADGVVVAGSTYDRDNDDPEPSVQSHEVNLTHAAQLLPQARLALDASTLEGAVGFRCVAPDRMPLAGAMPDLPAARLQAAALSGAQLADLPRSPGLYCASAYASRGLIWASLAGELLASRIEGEPLPLEGDLADALDPARFVLKQLRRGTL